MSAPEPLTVNVPPANDVDPASPTAPMSVCSHGDGSVAGAALMTTVETAVATAPALSVTVNVRVNVPAAAYTCDAPGVAEGADATPSPHCHSYEVSVPAAVSV